MIFWHKIAISLFPHLSSESKFNWGWKKDVNVRTLHCIKKFLFSQEEGFLPGCAS